MERCIDRAFIGNWTSLNSALIEPYSVLLSSLKMMIHETIRNEDFLANTVLQHRCDIISNGYNNVPILQRCVVQKIVVASRPVSHPP